MSDWIKCSERMPEEGERVLFVAREPWTNGRVVRRVEFGTHSGHGWSVAYDLYEGESWTNGEVTHWMQLPDPPKEEP